MRFLTFLVFLGFLAFALFARWYFICELRQQCGSGERIDARLQTLQLTKGDSVLLRGYDQFAFDSAALQPRLNGNNQLFLDTLASILRERPRQNLTVTALYRESEKGIAPGFFENPGLARADRIRKLIMQRGIDQDRLTLDYGVSEDRRLREPMMFDLYDPAAIEGGYEKVLFTFKNMTFSDANFAYNSYEFTPGPSLKLYADSVKTYLDLNPEAMLSIVGHTDSIGSEIYNMGLGLRRAESARYYFQDSLGVTADIEIDSEGEARPVAPNTLPNGEDNPEGRQKNRRVNFILSTAPDSTTVQETKPIDNQGF